MNQSERRRFLIQALLDERGEGSFRIPDNSVEQKQLLRSLMNVRLPQAADAAFLRVQDEYLREEIAAKGITDIRDLTPLEDGIYLWQGDITTLRCGAIVNAANSGMTGCYVPCHRCIDNAIHTFAGVQLRHTCGRMMKEQGFDEPTGRAKITPAYNLPCDYVIHTVGPIVGYRLTAEDEELLRSCYRSCLETAYENDVDSIAFCCISTGEFHFPNDRAAEIAVDAVREFRQESGGGIDVIFNVFKDLDYQLYRQLLG